MPPNKFVGTTEEFRAWVSNINAGWCVAHALLGAGRDPHEYMSLSYDDAQRFVKVAKAAADVVDGISGATSSLARLVCS